MSKIKNCGLDQYGAEPFEQQQFETAGVEGVNMISYTHVAKLIWSRDYNCFWLIAGAVFGAMASVEVVCMILGTFTFNAIYSETLSVDPGFVFLVMALFYGLSCVLLV